MSFERSRLLEELGVAHGFGGIGSATAQIRNLSTPRQVHGSALVRAPLEHPARADAVWSDAPGTAVGVVTADCVPALLYSPRAKAVAAVHAGWRGSAERITQRVASDLGAADLVAAIGPHIGACCYEVDAPVRERLAMADAYTPASREAHWMLDLFAVNRAQLIAAGVAPAHVERVGGCTGCDAERYHSYRREGAGGRMLHWARSAMAAVRAPLKPLAQNSVTAACSSRSRVAAASRLWAPAETRLGLLLAASSIRALPSH